MSKGRVAYRFMGRCGDQYVWQSKQYVPGTNRVEEVRCSVSYFWSGGKS